EYAGLFADQGDFDIPASYGVGMALQPTPALTLAFDVQRIAYSDVAAVGNPINGLFAGAPLGSDDGPGFGWRDMTVYKLGAAYRMNDSLTVRAGYNYGRQPIPTGQTLFNILAPGTVEHHLTLGATWTLASGNEVTVMYAHALRKQVDGRNSIPPAFGGGEANIHLSEDLLGVAFAWKL
ncbi:MAG: outer membrane protein transport protein, partial [Burkholderiales bacterium]